MRLCKQYQLNGHWLMRRKGEAKWQDAVVPGSVYSDLLRLGKMEDPFFRENEAAALHLCDYDYEYLKTFSLEPDFLECDRAFLRCDGLDTLCRIYLNGKKIAETCNMHRRYSFDVTKNLLPGRNSLRILFLSPVRYVEKMQKKNPLVNGTLVNPGGVSYLRKAHYMFGWDWGPALPDMGIWRSVALCGFKMARIKNWAVRQEHREGSVHLTVLAELEKYTKHRLTVLVSVTTPDGKTIHAEKDAAATVFSLQVEIRQPQLWWPNGMGEHPLYRLDIAVKWDGDVLDARTAKIGLRTICLKQRKDRWGRSFCFSVNGTDLFAMGANYIPEDNILSRCSRTRTERLIRDCARAHFNLLRVWGGGVYPEDYFYDLCDENGLLVWQDFMFACGVYNFSPAFQRNVGEEVVGVLRRIRHHACLALLCGNNEQELQWMIDDRFRRAAPKLKADYIRQFETFMPELAHRNAPGVPYWYASPSSGGSFSQPNSESAGDMHDWEVWHGRKPFAEYRNVFPRFLSEFGMESFPCLKTVRSFTKPSDRNPFSPVMEAHQKDKSGNEKILSYLSQYCRYPKDFDSLLYVSQIVQAEGIRCGVEHLRRLRGRCMGTVYWQLNDCWPAASWSSIDYFGRWKALHYAARRFFAPVLASARERGSSVALSVTNDTGKMFSGVLSWRLRTREGRTLAQDSLVVEIPAFTSRPCAKANFERYLRGREALRSTYLQYDLMADGWNVGGGTVLFVPPKHFDFTDPKLGCSVLEREDSFLVVVSAEAFAKFIELDLKNADAIFSDNYFDLSAGETRRVTVRKEDLSVPLTGPQFKSLLRVRSLYDTF